MLYPGSDESIWAINDIDARKRSEMALARSEERFRHLTELSSDWYWEQDEGLRYTFVSSGADSIKRGAGDPIGKTRWELPHVDTDPALMRAHDALLAAHKPFKGLVIKRLRLNNSIMYAEISGEPVFDEDGRFQGYRGVGRDITDRMRDAEGGSC
jgi:PAS domain S-box-containing protein